MLEASPDGASVQGPDGCRETYAPYAAASALPSFTSRSGAGTNVPPQPRTVAEIRRRLARQDLRDRGPR